MKVDYAEVRRLLRLGGAGALGTHAVSAAGYPFVSSLPYGLDEACRPVFLVSGLAEHTRNLSAGMGFIAAAVSTGLACLGAGLAVASVGSAALGLVGEKPEMLGTTLIYLGLSEGIAIYGVIVSLLILGRV